MKKVLYSIAATLVLAASAHAQAPAASATPGLPLDQLYPGYQATIIQSPDAVNQLFNDMPRVMQEGGFLTPASQCFQRAEIWSYDLYKTKNVNAMKIFIFYTAAYKKLVQKETGHSFAWWFHVAPYVVNKDAKGNLTESVLDPTFEKTPVNVYDWTRLDIKSDKPCKENVRYQDFQPELENGFKGGTELCYLVRVPGTDYDPVSVENRDNGTLTGYDWDMGDVNYALNHAVIGSDRKALKETLGLGK
jgi:hypothetical protein